MTQKEYLRRLDFALRGSFTREERRDVLSDYAGFFAEGEAEGDAVERLGTPSAVALSLAQEAGKRRTVGAWTFQNERWLRPLLGTVIFAAAWFAFRIPFLISGVSIFNQLLFTIVMEIVMCAALAFGFHRESSSFAISRGLIIRNGVILALGIFCCLFFGSQSLLTVALWVMENTFLQNGISEIRLLCVLVTLCIGVLAVRDIRRGQSEGLITTVHAVGFLVYLERVGILWGDMSDLPVYYHKMMYANILYITVFAAALVIAFILRKRAKGVDSHAR